MRQVGVAIRPREGARLHDSDHGNKHAQKPQPAGEEVRALAPGSPRRRGGKDQQQHRRGDLPAGKATLGMGIIDRQTGGPERVAEVGGSRNYGIPESPRKRPLIQRRNHRLRRNHLHHTGGGREGKERDLFPNQQQERPGACHLRRQLATGIDRRRDAAQRPVIE